jgi:hypothetical protein
VRVFRLNRVNSGSILGFAIAASLSIHAGCVRSAKKNPIASTATHEISEDDIRRAARGMPEQLEMHYRHSWLDERPVEENPQLRSQVWRMGRWADGTLSSESGTESQLASISGYDIKVSFSKTAFLPHRYFQSPSALNAPQGVMEVTSIPWPESELSASSKVQSDNTPVDLAWIRERQVHVCDLHFSTPPKPEDEKTPREFQFQCRWRNPDNAYPWEGIAEYLQISRVPGSRPCRRARPDVA